jgi:hypothetical protein
MITRKFITFAKVLTLLLLVSFSVGAKTTVVVNETTEKGNLSLNKASHSYHQNMLQPQVVHVSITSEHSVKPISIGYAAFLFSERPALIIHPVGQSKELLQDTDRCESVSRLLFPFHYFW